jgi:uncharacterized protein (DUF2235 family)
MYGLIAKGNEALVPYGIRMLMAILTIETTNETNLDQVQAYFTLENESIRDCKPHFVGVWDTVSSVGWYENPLRLPYTQDNPDIAIGRHVIALDERRSFFRRNLWIPNINGGPKERQVWFAGVHCDVGGGIRKAEADSPRSRFSGC